MKYLLFLLITINIGFAQMANGMKTPDVQFISLSDRVNVSNKMESFNLAGRIEIVRSEFFVNMGNNEYWIRNSELKSAKGDLYNFSESLTKNGIAVIEQVDAQYGYILVTVPGQKDAIVYIAGDKGSKASDPIEIEL